jgi:hypothetical protein
MGKRFKLPEEVFWGDFATRMELIPTQAHQQNKT